MTGKFRLITFYRVTECGVMNFFVLIKNSKGEKELVTASLDGTILPGVTRRSIIDIAKEWGVPVVERDFTIHELFKLKEENRLLEAFGSGTAAVVVPIRKITYQNKLLTTLEDEKEIGDFTRKIYETITSIQYGEISHPFQHKI